MNRHLNVWINRIISVYSSLTHCLFFSYLTSCVFRGERKVHIRWYDEQGVPTKKGICLNMTQVKTLLDCATSISEDADNLFANLQPGDIHKYALHIGYGSYISCEIFQGLKYFDIRRYWVPPNTEQGTEPIPTTKGCKLHEDQFALFKDQKDLLYEIIPELSDIEDCKCLFDNQLQFLSCARCNPFDCLNWL